MNRQVMREMCSQFDAITPKLMDIKDRIYAMRCGEGDTTHEAMWKILDESLEIYTIFYMYVDGEIETGYAAYATQVHDRAGEPEQLLMILYAKTLNTLRTLQKVLSGIGSDRKIIETLH